jgi:hypothetical protein
MRKAGKPKPKDDDAHLTSHTGKGIKPDDNLHMGFTKGEAEPVKQLTDACDSLSARMDAFERRRSMRRPEKVKPRTKDGMQPSVARPKEPGG